MWGRLWAWNRVTEESAEDGKGVGAESRRVSEVRLVVPGKC